MLLSIKKTRLATLVLTLAGKLLVGTDLDRETFLWQRDSFCATFERTLTIVSR